MNILLVTDAWLPQVNGVVRTYQTVIRELEAMGHAVRTVTPDQFRSFPCPTYPEIRLSVVGSRGLGRIIDEEAPDAIHIATEGPLGVAARRACLKRKLPFTTSFHTKFPEYVYARFRLPVSWSYAWMRRFHAASQAVMVATPSLARELEGWGFTNVRPWTRGVDTALFHPREETGLDLQRPISLFVGRVAVEKNIAAFLDLDIDGTKLVVGDGPMLDELRHRYPKAVFAGKKEGEELARHFAAADVFVFPSRTDTFGLVLLEALASGVPVAAYPVTGPLDVVDGAGVGVLDDDLGKAVRSALQIPAEQCRSYAMNFSWRACAEKFLGNLALIAR
ncbi:MAG: alpha-mannosyltransferase [Rhodospirillaceae bacterium]|nr:alpha-mannosyltransferase [Rhodospirillaceae bacterium]